MEGVERYVERFAIEEHTHLSKLKQKKTKNNYIKIMTCGRDSIRSHLVLKLLYFVVR